MKISKIILLNLKLNDKKIVVYPNKTSPDHRGFEHGANTSFNGKTEKKKAKMMASRMEERESSYEVVAERSESNKNGDSDDANMYTLKVRGERIENSLKEIVFEFLQTLFFICLTHFLSP